VVRNLFLCLTVAVLSSLITWELATRRRHLEGAQAPSPSKPKPPEAPELRPTEKIRAEKVSLTVRSGGKKLWELEAKEVVLSKDEQTLIVEGLDRAVLYKQGKPYLTVTAERARANNVTKTVVVEGGVKAVTADGLLIRTERIEWDDKERKLLCPGEVVVSGKGVTVSTRSVAFYVEKGLLVCPSPVEAWTPEGGRLFAQKLRADVKRGILTLEGKVRAIIPVKGGV